MVSAHRFGSVLGPSTSDRRRADEAGRVIPVVVLERRAS
ncbi:hypothetical protein BJ983_002738 [Actinomycetospora corticicola]|uniref:Uncharacterized protein n=1 Tax=Actinomycetospora corticicola TaxID=663602 RepID=A0A7Y9J637_9PSEU|nr:hypothetical protein [Actinomycetospora corticicola]